MQWNLEENVFIYFPACLPAETNTAKEDDDANGTDDDNDDDGDGDGDATAATVTETAERCDSNGWELLIAVAMVVSVTAAMVELVQFGVIINQIETNWISSSVINVFVYFLSVFLNFFFFSLLYLFDVFCI